MLQVENQLHEWRELFRKVKYCYGCRVLKGKEEFYVIKQQEKKVKLKICSSLCKSCYSIYKKLEYKTKKTNGG